MNGYKTYASLIIVALGFVGIGDDIVNEQQVADIINAIMQAVGILGAVYGKWHADHRKRQEIEALTQSD